MKSSITACLWIRSWALTCKLYGITKIGLCLQSGTKINQDKLHGIKCNFILFSHETFWTNVLLMSVCQYSGSKLWQVAFPVFFCAVVVVLLLLLLLFHLLYSLIYSSSTAMLTKKSLSTNIRTMPKTCFLPVIYNGWHF